MKIRSSQKQFLLPVEHGLFNHCHASTITTLPNGDLLAAFFAGRREGEGDVAIWTVHARQGYWQMPVRQMAEEGLAHWNPVLHAEGDTVWLFYKVGPNVHEWVTRWTVSLDGGRIWSAPCPLVPGDHLPRGPVRNKLLVMSNGEWAAPSSVETEKYWDSFVDISWDQGKNWSKYDVPIDHQQNKALSSNEVWTGLADEALWETDVKRIFQWDGIIQPALWESSPGCIHMLMRSTRGYIYRSDSDDFGRTWCPAYATCMPNNNSGIDLAHLAGGQLILASNPIGGNWGQRYPISLACSADNGQTWEHLFDMETEEGEFSYPAIVSDAGNVHITYTWNRKNIVHCRVALE